MMGKTDRALIVGALALITIALAVLLSMILGQKAQIQENSRTIAGLKAQLAVQSSRIQGVHRDLITCGDIQNLLNNGYLAQYYLDLNYNLQSTVASLPRHCING